ncbi:MAG: nitronate monooxygenase family protein [Elusimicrobiota bacterium]
MKLDKLPTLRIGNLEAKIPIIQGGMGVRISLAGLASAVANEGGIGVISATGIGIDESDSLADLAQANSRVLAKEIKRSRQLTSGIIGINAMVALTDYENLVTTAFAEQVDIVFAGAGLPLKLPNTISVAQITNGPTKFVPIVSSARAANIIFKSWQNRYNHVPDGIVLEGPLAGGHLGFSLPQITDPNFTLKKLLAEVLPVADFYGKLFNKKIPVIVGGGIYSGADIYEYLQAGAQGVQMGTRFVTTYECDASEKFKEAYVQCKKEDIQIISSPVGMPGRAIKNTFLKNIEAGMKQKFTCPFKCLKSCNFKEASYCIAKALGNAQKGNLDDGFVFCGANAFMADKIVSVHELINTLIEEFNLHASSLIPAI